MGVCSVTFNGVDLGHTLGGVEVSYEPFLEDKMVDKYGKTPIDQVFNGEKLSAKVPLAEFTIANLAIAIPTGTFGGAGNARLTIGHSAGPKQSSVAYQLVLHPISEGTRRHDIILYKAAVNSQITLQHKNDEQKIIEVEFVAYIDETKSDGNYLGMIGDSTE